MTGDSLEIEYLCTLRGKRGQQTGFAATGETTDEPEAESLRMRCQQSSSSPWVSGSTAFIASGRLRTTVAIWSRIENSSAIGVP